MEVGSGKHFRFPPSCESFSEAMHHHRAHRLQDHSIATAQTMHCYKGNPSNYHTFALFALMAPGWLERQQLQFVCAGHKAGFMHATSIPRFVRLDAWKTCFPSDALVMMYHGKKKKNSLEHITEYILLLDGMLHTNTPWDGPSAWSFCFQSYTFKKSTSFLRAWFGMIDKSYRRLLSTHNFHIQVTLLARVAKPQAGQPFFRAVSWEWGISFINVSSIYPKITYNNFEILGIWSTSLSTF